MENSLRNRLMCVFPILILFSLLQVTLVFAGTNGHTQSDAVGWANSQVGKSLDIDGKFGAQCVDFTCYYYQYLGQAIPWGNAYEYVNGGKFCPSGWSYQGSPAPGDVAVWRGDPGHVAIVTEIRGTQMVCVEQNYAGKMYVSPNLHSIDAYTYIRPDFASPVNHDPTIAFDGVDVSNGKVHVTGWAYDPDDVARSIDVHVYLFQNGNPTCIGGTTANVSRVDVDNALHIGQFHGFDATFETSVRGDAEVQVAAINVGEGSNKWGDKKNITIAETGSEMGSGYSREIPDGDYLIVSSGSSDKTTFYYLDIEGISVPASNGTNVSLCGPLAGEPGSCEIWTVRYIGGFYTIKQKGTNQSLDVKGINREKGANIQVHQYNGGTNQQWAISKNGKNGYRIQSRCSGYSLDVAGGVIANGKNVMQHPSHNGDNQAWMFIPYKPAQPIANGRYILVSALDHSKELDVAGDTGNVPQNVNVQIWSDTAQSKYNSFDITALENGYYKIIHTASGKSLDMSGGLPDFSANIVLHDSNGSIAQQWAITPSADGYVIIAKCSGYAMDVESGKIADGTNVSQYPYNYAKNQIWKFVKAEYTVAYNANGGSGAPANQIKYYKNNLNLSANKPNRSGYSFLGWSKSSTATKADYLSGGSYTTDADITLYAVWLNNTNGSIQPSGGNQTRSGNQSSSGSQATVSETPAAPQEPITIDKVPASVKAKAKKNKVTISWKKIKKSKKTKALLAQIQGIEVQYSTYPTFPDGSVKVSLGKKKTKLVLKGLQPKTAYYVRVRYADGLGGVSNWSGVKRVVTN